MRRLGCVFGLLMSPFGPQDVLDLPIELILALSLLLFVTFSRESCFLKTHFSKLLGCEATPTSSR